MQKGSLEYLKKINRDLVLESIRADQPTSRAKIAKKLNLSRSTVSLIVDELIAKKFVIETGLSSSTKEGGRRAIELGFNPRSAFGVGVELQESGLMICIADLDGNIVWKKQMNTDKDFGTVARCIQDCLHEGDVPFDRVMAVGFCVPGLTNSKEGIIVDAPLLGWKNVPFVAEMKKLIDKPVYINNDVNCAALGERWVGGAKELDDFIYIYIGSGVGSAIVANGSLLHGKDYMAGEIAYLVFDEEAPDQRVNVIGEFGVFEKKTSVKALLQSHPSIQEVFEAYRQGEERAVLAVNRFVSHLSMGVANMISLLNPEKVLIGGEIADYLPFVLGQIQDKVSRITPIRAAIEAARAGTEAGVLGVIAFAFEQERNSM